MKTALIGGGRGCLAVLELYVQGRLDILDMEIAAVVDRDADAPGSVFASKRGWTTLTCVEEALSLPHLEFVVELTGSNDVLDLIYAHLPPGARVMDHVMANIFWDLEKLSGKQREQLLEKEELEKELAAEHSALRQILDTIPDMVIDLDPEMRIKRLNRRFAEETGLNREEAEQQLHRRAFSLTEATDNPVDFVAPFYSVIETKSPATVVQEHQDEGGRERCFQVTANPIIDTDGKVVRVVQTAHEVTELIMLKRESEEQGRRFRQIVDAVHGIITIKDRDGRFQLVNPRAERLYGLSQNEMIGRTVRELFPGGACAIVERNDQAMFEKGAHQMIEEVLTIRGREHVLVAERFPLKDYKDEVVAVCCVARDVTRTRTLHRELIRSERLAAVGKLAAGVAHELNNPLTGILTFAEDLFLETDVHNPDRDDYEVIMNEAMRCRRIVRDLLDYSRQKEPERQRMPIAPVVMRVLTMVERQASFHNIRFDIHLDDGLAEVNIDPGQIQQAILNLVINARDAMNSNGVIRVSTNLAVEDQCIVEVEDSGCGISESRLSEVFEPFYTTKGDLGNGLGLPAVLSLAEQNSGQVEVESVVGIGSTFRLVLPLAKD